MTVLLKDALAPNLVQTLEGNPCLRARRAVCQHCARVQQRWWPRAPRSSWRDYVVTEAGFGADLGAEKFIDIKCRKSGLVPQRGGGGGHGAGA
jgi:formate--tetrahydrofolate ligase